MENIKKKLETYFQVSNDIEKLEEYKTKLKQELEDDLRISGVNSLTTSLGTISYVSRNYKTLDKNFIESILTDEQKQKAYTEKESKFIKITKAKDKEAENNEK
jgi:hypothetical protein